MERKIKFALHSFKCNFDRLTTFYYKKMSILNNFNSIKKSRKSMYGHCVSLSPYSFPTEVELRFPSCGSKGSTSHLKNVAIVFNSFSTDSTEAFLCSLFQDKEYSQNH